MQFSESTSIIQPSNFLGLELWLCTNQNINDSNQNNLLLFFVPCFTQYSYYNIPFSFLTNICYRGGLAKIKTYYCTIFRLLDFKLMQRLK